MPSFADSPSASDGPNIYDELLAREEKSYARRGGRLVLLGNDHVARQMQPPPLLAALRAGEPVDVEDWQIPGWARPGAGAVRNVRLRVHPDGWVEETDE